MKVKNCRSEMPGKKNTEWEQEEEVVNNGGQQRLNIIPHRLKFCLTT